jgi:DNA invertase Pin-like site-specific DNA recombinase
LISRCVRCALSAAGLTTSGKMKSGATNALELALTQAMAGDVFIVATMRSLPGLQLAAGVLAELQRRGTAFRALAEKFDSRAFIAKDAITPFVRAAATYREAVSERILFGLKRARERGRVGGRRPVLSAEKRAEAERLIARGRHTMAEVAARVGVSRRTLYNGGLIAGKKNSRP